MSIPTELFIRRDGEQYIEVFFGKRAATDLFDYMLPKMREIDSNYADAFEGQFYGDVMSIIELPEKHFTAVYKLIMRACDELESLKPYRDDLKQALESDPRYHAAQ